MKKQELEKFEIAGKVAAELRQKLLRQVKPGVRLGVLADAAEKVITDLGPQFRPAFPLNISINEVAAHDTARIDDQRIIPKRAMVKIDLGVSYDGYLSDCARTVVLGMHSPMVKAAEEALDKAIETARPGIKIKELGKVIEATIQEYGFEPVRNLSGHSIQRYSLHAGLSIPNSSKHLSLREGNKKLEEGMVIAIEPFVTESKTDPYVKDGGKPQIFRIPDGRMPRTALGKKWYRTFRTIPFSARMAARFLANKKSAFKKVLSTVRAEEFQEYPPLVDVNGALVSQAEDTIYIGKQGARVLTRLS